MAKRGTIVTLSNELFANRRRRDKITQKDINSLRGLKPSMGVIRYIEKIGLKWPE